MKERKGTRPEAGPAREERKQLAADPGQVEGVLRRGAQKARAEAQQTMALVRRAVGMRPQPAA
jgi:tryptophanyl-tRNA synthetase